MCASRCEVTKAEFKAYEMIKAPRRVVTRFGFRFRIRVIVVFSLQNSTEDTGQHVYHWKPLASPFSTYETRDSTL